MGIINRKPVNQDSLLQRPLNNESISNMTNSISIVQNLQNHKSRINEKLERQIEISSKKSIQDEKWYQKVYFTPQSKFILIFKTLTLGLIYLYFLEIPITIAFEKHRNEDESEQFFERINIPAITIFLAGVFIKLKTAFYKQGILISDQRQIIINYFLYIFVFDFLSIVSVIIYQFSEILRDKTSKEPISYRYIVILFYLKIPQLFQIEKSIIASFDLNRRVKAFFKLILLLTKIFMLCNIASCCFFYISDNSCPMDECSDCCWINQVEIQGKTLKQAEWSMQYTFSLYWASTTMLTIGYGDITPENMNQVVYTITAQFISCVLFAFSINEIWSIIQEKNSKKLKIHSRMNVINVYMRDKNVPPELKSRVNAYLSHFYHTKNLREKELENQIIAELTPSLRKQLYFQSYGFLFNNHEFFKNFSEEFLEQVSQFIREVGYFEEEIVYEPGSQQISLYYVYKGELESFLQLGNSKTSNIELNQYKKGSIIGLFQFVRQLNYNSSLMAMKYSLMYVLEFENWARSIRNYQEDNEKYYKLKHKAQYEKKYKSLNVFCNLCGSCKHQQDMCITDQIGDKKDGFLSNYLRRSYRVPYMRKNMKLNTDLKSLSPEQKNAIRRSRKSSFSLRKSFIKSEPNKKSFFHKQTHYKKIHQIIEKKKYEQSFVSQDSESDGQMLDVVLNVDSVQNYDYYWPEMNSTTDWTKYKRRLTFNRILSKQ